MTEKNNRHFITLLVDDDVLAREHIKVATQAFSQIEIRYEASTLSKAKEILQKHHIDLIFLDIKLGKNNGFDLLEHINTSTKVVFITGYEEYAIRAFEINALDYIIKPVEEDRFKTTLKRLGQPPIREELLPIAESINVTDQILIRSQGKHYLLKLSTVKCICSMENYSEVYTEEHGILIERRSLIKWTKMLPDSHFIKISRTAIVNLRSIEKVEKQPSEPYVVYIKGLKEPLTTSRRNTSTLKLALKQWT